MRRPALAVDTEDMYRPAFTSTAALGPTTTRETPCGARRDADQGPWQAVDDGALDEFFERELADQERRIELLEAEFEDWSRHPSNSTWSQPARDDD